MERNRVLLLVAAVALIAVSVVASRCADESEGPEQAAKAEGKARAEKVVFPRDRRQRRLPPKATPVTSAPEKPRREPGVDPIQRAMAFPDGGAVFVEVNAIRHSELVEKLLACRGDEASDAMSRFKEQVGVDPFEDVDRIAVHEDVFAASGFFDELKLPPEAGEATAYGDGSQLYTLRDPEDPDGTPTVLGKVGNGLLLLGEDEAEVKAAIDRAEGRGEATPPLPADVMGTEVYGRFGPELLGQLVGGGQGASDNPLVQRIAEIVTDGTVRVLVDDAVSMSLDLETTNEQDGEDLAKAIGGALAGARQQARNEGNEELAALLDQARVLKQPNGRFGIDVAVPGDTLLDVMGCKEPVAAETGAGTVGEPAAETAKPAEAPAADDAP